MNDMTDFTQYLNQQRIASISLGQSGAEVCRLNGGLIAKHVQRQKLPNADLWEKYRQESMFFSHISAAQLPFIPEVIHNELREDELLLILREYSPLPKQAMQDPAILSKVLDVLVQLHSLPVPPFLPKQPPEVVQYSAASLAECREGWLQVLGEHSGRFSLSALEKISRSINEINIRLFAPNCGFVHGDFHCENLLMDKAGNILVCDWQNFGYGEISGDLAFLLSRLRADGFSLDENLILEQYCLRAGIQSAQNLASQMRLASLNTSFLFWHMYLHGSSPERVEEIYHKMCADMEFLQSLC